MLLFFLDYSSKPPVPKQANTSLFDIISNNDFENSLSNCSSDDENRLQIGKIFNYTHYRLNSIVFLLK